jgi:hypothetical protein
MSETVHREKDLLSDVRVVVEVDGRPVGFLNRGTEMRLDVSVF